MVVLLNIYMKVELRNYLDRALYRNTKNVIISMN